jgi:hypothetical protein
MRPAPTFVAADAGGGLLDLIEGSTLDVLPDRGQPLQVDPEVSVEVLQRFWDEHGPTA